MGESARDRLGKLCSYLARPVLAQDRLSVAKNGHIVYRFRKAWRNGKTAVVLDPMRFLSRLAAQVSPSRFHMLTYHGVLGASAARRDEIVPGYQLEGEDGPCPPRSRSRAKRSAAGGRVKRQH